jgi:hypothetical protein
MRNIVICLVASFPLSGCFFSTVGGVNFVGRETTFLERVFNPPRPMEIDPSMYEYSSPVSIVRPPRCYTVQRPMVDVNGSQLYVSINGRLQPAMRSVPVCEQ